MSAEADSRKAGIVRAIAYRPAAGDPMIETTQCRVLVRRGLETEDRKPGKREVTLLSLEAWADACRELNVELPWRTRRANLLVEGLDLTSAVGSTISAGEARLKVHGESKPCGLMDQQYEGLRAALARNGRGGVYAQVLTGGRIRVGDPVTIACITPS